MLVLDPLRQTAVTVADDLTGSTEIALALADAGLGKLAWLWNQKIEPPVGQSCSINLATRDLPVDQACQRLVQFLDDHPNLRAKTIFKKIDSTARRHIAAELDIFLRYPEFDAAVVALAAPDDRRHTLNGIHHVGQIPVDRTPFAHDLVQPTAYLPTLLTAGTNRTCLHVSMETVRKGSDDIEAAIGSGLDAGTPIISMDCESREDLRRIAHAILRSPGKILPVGSAAMFRELISVATQPTVGTHLPIPVLVICGSLHPVSRKQIEHLCSSLGAVAQEMKEGEDENLVNFLSSAISLGRVAVLTTPVAEDSNELSQNQMAQRVGALVQAIIERSKPKGLIAMGGNIASAVIDHLGADGLRILDRLSPVVPVLGIVGGPFSGLPIVTKGGGVGTENILIDAVEGLGRLAGNGFIDQRKIEAEKPE